MLKCLTGYHVFMVSGLDFARAPRRWPRVRGALGTKMRSNESASSYPGSFWPWHESTRENSLGTRLMNPGNIDKKTNRLYNTPLALRHCPAHQPYNVYHCNCYAHWSQVWVQQNCSLGQSLLVEHWSLYNLRSTYINKLYNRFTKATIII